MVCGITLSRRRATHGKRQRQQQNQRMPDKTTHKVTVTDIHEAFYRPDRGLPGLRGVINIAKGQDYRNFVAFTGVLVRAQYRHADARGGVMEQLSRVAES